MIFSSSNSEGFVSAAEWQKQWQPISIWLQRVTDDNCIINKLLSVGFDANIVIFTVVFGVNEALLIVYMMQVPISCCCTGCPWVPESVSGPAEGGCGEDQQKLEERALSLGGASERTVSRWGGHFTHLHLPGYSQHGVWSAAHHNM